MGISIGHLLIVLLIVLLLFGAKKLRSIGADLGGAVKGFRDSMGDGNKDAEAAAAKERIENQAARNTKKTTTTDKKQSKNKDRRRLMFDIGFSEIVLFAIVALLVVGPKEFPT